MNHHLPEPYAVEFEGLLAAVAAASREPAVPLVPFWPLAGAAYEGDLLVIGRSVNGWIADWTPAALARPDARRGAVARMRSDAERADRCRMSWVTDLWGNRDGYNTARSAFWRVQRSLLRDGLGLDDPAWASRIVWTNLYKVSPAAGWNPGADLQRVQRAHAARLLRAEIEVFRPSRVLALTGGWIDPFANDLELRLDRRSGLVEGVGTLAGRPCVVAKHPMGKPHVPFVQQVLAGFRELGSLA